MALPSHLLQTQSKYLLFCIAYKCVPWLPMQRLPMHTIQLWWLTITIIIQRLWCCHRDQSHCKSLAGSFDKCRLNAGVSANPQTKPTNLGCESTDINGWYHPHPPSPFIIIIQPESWYWFYRPTEGGRLSRPSHCRKTARAQGCTSQWLSW